MEEFNREEHEKKNAELNEKHGKFSDDSKCCLEEWGGCCCTCRFRKTDFEHCSTNKELRDKVNDCICSIQKGWICDHPEMESAFSGWKEHGFCECHTT